MKTKQDCSYTVPNCQLVSWESCIFQLAIALFERGNYGQRLDLIIDKTDQNSALTSQRYRTVWSGVNKTFTLFLSQVNIMFNKNITLTNTPFKRIFIICLNKNWKKSIVSLAQFPVKIKLLRRSSSTISANVLLRGINASLSWGFGVENTQNTLQCTFPQTGKWFSNSEKKNQLINL